MFVRIKMYVDMGSTLLFDAVSLIVVWAYTLGEISFSDVDRNPPTTRPVLCLDVVSELPAAEGNWKLEDFVAIGTSSRADPIPCIGHCRHAFDKNCNLPQSRFIAPGSGGAHALHRDPSGVGYPSGLWILASNSAFRPKATRERLFLARISSASVALAARAAALLSSRAEALFSAVSTALGSFLGRSSLSAVWDSRASSAIAFFTVAVPVRLGAPLSQDSPDGPPS